METYGYEYTAQARLGQVGFTYRPLVNVDVGNVTETGNFKALVDSGTDVTVMDMAIAKLLKVDSQDRELGSLSGLEEWREGFVAPVSLKVDQFSKVFNFNVLFIEDLSRNFDIILGQQDFFQNFNVTFKKSENKFYLQLAF